MVKLQSMRSSLDLAKNFSQEAKQATDELMARSADADKGELPRRIQETDSVYQEQIVRLAALNAFPPDTSQFEQSRQSAWANIDARLDTNVIDDVAQGWLDIVGQGGGSDEYISNQVSVIIEADKNISRLKEQEEVNKKERQAREEYLAKLAVFRQQLAAHRDHIASVEAQITKHDAAISNAYLSTSSLCDLIADDKQMEKGYITSAHLVRTLATIGVSALTMDFDNTIELCTALRDHLQLIPAREASAEFSRDSLDDKDDSKIIADAISGLANGISSGPRVHLLESFSLDDLPLDVRTMPGSVRQVVVQMLDQINGEGKLELTWQPR